MMQCGRCKAGTEVMDSREKNDGTIRRRRRCVVCGEKFTTYELRAGTFMRPSRFDGRLGRVRLMLRTLTAAVDSLETKAQEPATEEAVQE